MRFMTHAVRFVREHHRLLWLLVLVIIIADQLSKAFFVYKLGAHQAADFPGFLLEYFTQFAWPPDAKGIIVQKYFPFNDNGPIMIWQPWIAFRLTTNTGAAWSILAGNSFALSGVSLVMAALLFVVWWRNFKRHTGMTWALGAIIGGALGNFIDRFRLHEVVDFISVKLPLIGKLFPDLGDPYPFPIFNIADSAAVCGTLALAGYLIFSDFRHFTRRQAEKKAGSEFKPYQAEMRLEPTVLDRLKDAEAQDGGAKRTTIGLTVHVGMPTRDNTDPH